LFGKYLVLGSYVFYVYVVRELIKRNRLSFDLYAVLYRLMTVNDPETIPFSESKEIFLALSFATLLHRRQVGSTNTSGSPAKDEPLNYSDRPIRSMPL
jgi:hypothetical protein